MIHQAFAAKLGRVLKMRVGIRSIEWRLPLKIVINELTLYKQQWVIRIDHLELQFSPLAFLKGQLPFAAVYIGKVSCMRAPADHKEILAEPTENNALSLDWLLRCFRLLCQFPDRLFKYLPRTLHIEQIDLSANLFGEPLEWQLHDLQLHDNAYTLCISARGIKMPACHLQGQIDKKAMLITVQHEGSNNPGSSCSVEIPGKNMFIQARELHLQVNKTAPDGLTVYFSVKNCRLNCPVVASREIDFSVFALQLHCRYHAGSFAVEDNSVIQFNEINCQLSASCNSGGDNTFQSCLVIRETQVSDFLRSFPYFTCRQLYQFSFTGRIPAIHIHFSFDPHAPFDYQFSIRAELKDRLQITRVPDNWPDINQPFTHHIYEHNELIRSLTLCPSNRYYRTIDTIPYLLASIIVHAEDENFYSHYGVDEIFVGYALIENLMKRKFSRGGSTITMQLVKNLFLDHNKTIYRKLEELFITLLLENVFRIPKSKLLEIYLNIIEFAPGIYGICEAADYYFSKQPEALTLNECIVLTYIIPRPKYFLDAVNCSSLQLKHNLKKHFRSMVDKLVLKGVIGQKDEKMLQQDVYIKGRVLSLEDA
ncbi:MULTISPECIES: biosynthetic peptidoglycan transglycosylase [Niastella]|uniref:Transglycosylase domain-containing protein n=1 Tax=Niastella soli TaxID=2821487 RepID=A0ABS3Z5V2_9BACT|nr:biosynthetic peptidoglycan transglycosylase [Niastella soli]MBO9205531.1 transglycosylase domain-containing protein [Niastella soli]